MASAMYSIGTAMLAIKKDIKFEYNNKRTYLTKAKLNLINDNNINTISY